MTKTAKIEQYFEAVGRRKTAVARVRLVAGGKHAILVNERNFDKYFPTSELQTVARRPLVHTKLEKDFSISAKIVGGGIHSQAEALSHAIARALIVSDSTLRTELKKNKFLTRDAREKERRKFGLKKARKSPQWSKR